MATHTTATHPVRYSCVGVQCCPQCGGDLFRIPRRASDRVLSLFARVQRYRCHFFSCKWEGNFRVDRQAFAPTGAGADWTGADGSGAGVRFPRYTRVRRMPTSFVANMVIAAAGVALVVLFTTTDLLRGDRDVAGTQLSDEQWVASARLKGDGVKLKPEPQQGQRTEPPPARAK